MTAFDWDRLAQNIFDLMYDGDNAAAYIRERIEAAFVPVDQWDDLKRLHAENCGAYDRACAEREWLRERAGPYTGHCITCAEATARAEAAEAENVKLRDRAGKTDHSLCHRPGCTLTGTSYGLASCGCWDTDLRARAEAAEAEVRRLQDTPNHIWAEARDTEWDAGFNHAVALFRRALGGEHE